VAISILAQIIAERTAGHAAPPAPAPALTVTAVTAAPDEPPLTATATDPVCGMEVVAADASIHLDVGGERFFFCCEGCRATFAAERVGHAGA